MPTGAQAREAQLSNTLTTADKLALMMTSAGSQRNLASLIGVTHQQIGRWLQGPKVNADTGVITNEPTNPAIIASINQAFSMHRDVSRQQARNDRLPFNSGLPVYMERKPFSDGRPGERVVAEHTQYMTPELRARVMVDAGTSGEYLNVSVRSVVDLRKYNARANTFAKSEAAEGVFRTRAQQIWRDQLLQALDDGIEQRPMFTAKEDFYRFIPVRYGREKTGIRTIKVPGHTVNDRVNDKLRVKHEPATGAKGTTLADQILFQTLPQWEAPKPKAKTKRKPQHATKAKGSARTRQAPKRR